MKQVNTLEEKEKNIDRTEISTKDLRI